MSSSSLSLPELNERLLRERGALVDTAEALRTRVRREARKLEPRRLLQQHPEAAMAGALLLGAAVGRVAGGVLRALLRS
ncbi:MAG: hypothetical protein ACRD1Y_02940 [Terriglobales bacterium]